MPGSLTVCTTGRQAGKAKNLIGKVAKNRESVRIAKRKEKQGTYFY
jgi:hypothetical protein